MYQNLIFHVDVNCAFLSWEAAYRIHVLGEKDDLRMIPSAVGGDVKKRHGVILAKSIPAKKYNIQTGESIMQALTKCPNLVLVSPRYDLYEKCSHDFLTILKEYAPNVEQTSIDEAYLDMTGTEALYGSPVTIANIIKNRIKTELGFTVNIGISTNKLLAKMASDFKKPDLVHTLFPEEIPKKMWPLPIRDLFFVGRATEKKLLYLGILTIGDLACTDISFLRSHLKKHGELIYNYANGIDLTLVNPNIHVNKGYGNSITVSHDITDYESAKHVLLSLCETVCARLRAHNVSIKLVSIEIKDYNFNHSSHQKQLLSATNVTNEIYHVACKLLEEHWDTSIPLRQLGVRTSMISNDDARQLNIFDINTINSFCQYEKLQKLDEAIDIIRGKYGDNSVMRASFLNSNINHMSGGLSREKEED